MNAALAHPLYIALKASLAVLLALAVVELLGIPDKLSATFVAVVCISPTVYSGARRGLEQIGASALGGGVTWALSVVLPQAAVMGVALFLAIWVCFAVGLARGFLVAAFTVLYLLVLPGAGPAAALEDRLASVAIGVASAIALNLLVSALSWKRVFTRRLAIARQAVAQGWEALSAALAGSASEHDRRALFEDCFGLLRALFEELSDAGRESRLLGQRPREAARQAMEAAYQLLALAHHGKDLALLLEHQAGPFPGAGARALALSRAVRALGSMPERAPLEPPTARAIDSAALAWEKAREAEQRFTGSRAA